MKSVRTMTMMATLSVGDWKARKTAKGVARKAEVEGKAKQGTLTATKHLMVGVEELERCNNRATALRNAWTDQTMPWFDAGPRVFAAVRAQDITMWVGDQDRDYIKNYVDPFLKVYPVLRANQQFTMGEFFDPKEFPETDVVRSKFYVRFDGPLALPNADDIRIVEGVDKAELDALVKQARAKEQAKVQAAMREASERLFARVQKMHEKLAIPIGDTGHIFRDSMIENIVEMVELMPQFNIIGDPDLDKLVKEAKKLTYYSPGELREDADKRAKAAKEAKAIASKLSGLFAPVAP